MSVGSYLELYTTLLGWHQFENVWNVLSATGIVFLPFLLILIKGFISASSAVAALRDAEITVALALSVVVLAVQPVLSLDPNVLKIQPACSDEEQVLGATGSSYDTAMSIPSEAVKVPIWWYGVMAIASGSTRAAMAGLDCQTDLRNTLIQVDTQRIQDPLTLYETMQFIMDCFIPARSTFYRTQPQPPEVAALLEIHGPGDTEWFGSHVYRQIPGYYDRRRASVPISDWAYNSVRDTEPDLDELSGGRPYCKEWFEDSTIGLRAKLLAQVDTDWLEELRLNLQALKGFFDDDSFDMEKTEDGVIQGIVSNSVMVSPNGEVFATYTDAKGTETGATVAGITVLPSVNVTRAFAEAGTWWESLSYGPMMYAIRAGAPIIQALILLGIYIALPFGIVFSRYSWMLVFTATVAIFTLFFWSYLWHVAVWLENQLLVAIYATKEAVLNAATAGETDPNISIKTRLLTMAVSLMFIGFPLLFSAVIAWTGIVLGGGIASVFGQARDQFGRGGRAAADQAKTSAVSVASSSVARRIK